ncbi:MAG: hypothetical protein PHI37_01715 [Candidatus Gracilibacteria bacterium]|nr:hypothetical protein [Candidatus Gracilibacteria bacterium]
MKYLYLLVLSVFLVSCGAKAPEQTTDLDVENITNEVVSEINSELETIENVPTTNTNSDVMKIDAKYNNPAGEVDMTIDYTLSENGTIETIEVSATTYDLTEFNEEVKNQLIGKTIEEAKTANIAGGSLTTEAFKKALK